MARDDKIQNLTIFISGVSGSLGQRLSKVLLEGGNNVIGYDIVLPKGSLRDFHNFRFIKGDITDFDLLCSSVKGADAGVHCAALLPNRSYLGRELYIKVNSTGTENFLKACCVQKVPKAVLISNTGVLKPKKNGVTYDDADYRKSGSPYIESKILAEKKIDRLGLKKEINYVILRSSAIYGQGAMYKWKDIFNMARNSRLFVISKGDSLYSIVHIDDLIDAVLLAIKRLDKDISGEKITITSDEKMTIYDILSFITDYYSAKPPVKIPFIPSLAGAYISQALSKVFQNEFLSSITPENMMDYKYGLFFDNSKAERLLGFRSKRIYREEISEVLTCIIHTEYE